MKKILVSLLLLTFILIPQNVMAATEGFSVDKTSVTLNKNGTAQVIITAYNAVGLVNVTSSDQSIVLAAFEDSSNKWETGAIGPSETKTGTLVLIGTGEGTTTVTLKVTGALFTQPSQDAAKTITINVTVKESTEITPPVKSYTVTYDANGGKDAPTPQTKEENKELILHTNKPTKEGYEFVEWNTKADGSGTKYTAGGKYTVNSDIKLYAQWKKKGNATVNPNTGDTIIYVVLLLALGALIYSYWYMKKAEEN